MLADADGHDLILIDGRCLATIRERMKESRMREWVEAAIEGCLGRLREE